MNWLAASGRQTSNHFREDLYPYTPIPTLTSPIYAGLCGLSVAGLQSPLAVYVWRALKPLIFLVVGSAVKINRITLVSRACAFMMVAV